MRQLFLIILLLSHFLLFPQATEEANIFNSVEKFLNCIKHKNVKDLKNVILKEIKLVKLSDTELMQLGIKVLNEEISPGEYILKVTGHNIDKFLNQQNILIEYKIKPKIGIEKMEEKEKVLKSYSEFFYYIKVLLTFKEGHKLIKEQECELNLLKISDKEYRIFGFII